MKKLEQLIIKYFENNLNEEETNLFKDLLEDEKNQAYFKEFAYLNHLLNSKNKFDYQKKLKQFRKETHKKNKFISVFKYAAAILIFVSAGYFFLGNHNTTTDTIVPIIVNNNIITGTDKAVLTLANGTQVSLEKGKDHIIAENIESNGEAVIYTNTNNSKPDIAYNYLTVPRGGQYFVKLSDGTQVWLNSESKLKYPENFIKGKTREVELLYGEAYFDVAASTNHDGAKFKVIHHKQEVEVLGTEFNIKAYHNETEVFTTLVEGVVKVYNALGDEILEPNQQTIIADASGVINVNTVDVNAETSWRRGVFNFKDKSLKEILKVLSRWYAMDVVVVDKEIESELFTGAFGREQNIEDILFLINKLTNIHYEINNKTIFFRK